MEPSEHPEYQCPISMCMMEDPVLLAETGVTYERREIEAWFAKGNASCPCTGVTLKSQQLSPNRALKDAIDNWKQADTSATPSTNIPRTMPPPSQISQLKKLKKGFILFRWCWICGSDSNDGVLETVDRSKTKSQASTASRSSKTKKYTPKRIANRMTAAVRCGDFASLTALDREGWSFDVLDDRGEGPIHVAINNYDVDMLNVLIEYGVSTEKQDKTGCTALHWAARWGNRDLCMSLLQAGAHVDVQSFSRTTPLHMACYWGRAQVARALVDHGADINAKNSKGETPIDFALRSPWDASRTVLETLHKKSTP